jgi:hypothetical protein
MFMNGFALILSCPLRELHNSDILKENALFLCLLDGLEAEQ